MLLQPIAEFLIANAYSMRKLMFLFKVQIFKTKTTNILSISEKCPPKRRSKKITEERLGLSIGVRLRVESAL